MSDFSALSKCKFWWCTFKVNNPKREKPVRDMSPLNRFTSKRRPASINLQDSSIFFLLLSPKVLNRNRVPPTLPGRRDGCRVVCPADHPDLLSIISTSQISQTGCSIYVYCVLLYCMFVVSSDLFSFMLIHSVSFSCFLVFLVFLQCFHFQSSLYLPLS